MGRSAASGEHISAGGPTMHIPDAVLSPGVAVRTSDELGLPSGAKEAYAFAVLGFLTLHGLPGTEPASTGARHPSVLGSLTPGRDGLRLPPPAGRRPTRLLLD